MPLATQPTYVADFLIFSHLETCLKFVNVTFCLGKAIKSATKLQRKRKPNQQSLILGFVKGNQLIASSPPTQWQ